MRIWIDLTNSPHINFFKPFVKKWKDEGHEVTITARNLANTIELINQNGWEYYEIGGHAGKNKVRKLLYFPKRVISLYIFLKRNKPEIGISHSSFYSPIVCKLLNIPSIYLNDNEHAKGNYLAFKFATLNMLPEFLAAKAKQLKWLEKYNIEFYTGIKEGIYLSQIECILEKKIHDKVKTKIFIRLEPWSAEYYRGNSDFMDLIVQKLNMKYEVVILPRSGEQTEHFKKNKFKGVQVSLKPMKLEDILKECIVFIGAGGSMTRELAFLGVPTLSVYQGDLLSVDKHLINCGIMRHTHSPKIEDIENLIKKQYLKNNITLFEKGTEAFELIDKKIKELGATKKK
jgi:predicted glycosyltransferase